MSLRKRIEKYRCSGGAADLVKVEVLVPPSARDDVLRLAAKLRWPSGYRSPYPPAFQSDWIESCSVSLIPVGEFGTYFFDALAIMSLAMVAASSRMS